MNNINYPAQFKSWNGFYASIKKDLTPEAKIIRYDYEAIDVAEPICVRALIFEYQIDYLKARCFDEFLAWYEKNIQVDPYEEHGYMGYYTDKIEDFLHIRTDVKYT